MKKIFAMALAAVFLFSACSDKTAAEGDYIVKINDTPVTAEEFGIYADEAVLNFEALGGSDIWSADFDGKTAEETAKETALNSLLTVKISAMKFDEYGYTLTEEEQNSDAEGSVKTMTQALLAKYGEGTVDKDFIRKIMEERAKYNKIKESTYANYDITDEQLKSLTDEYGQRYGEMYTRYSFKNVLVESEEAGNALIERFNNGEDFDTLAREYEMDEAVKETGWEDSVYRAQFEEAFGTDTVIEKGKLTPVLSADDGGYYVMLITDIAVPTEEEVAGFIKSEYLYYAREDIFNTEYEKWKGAVTVTTNEDAYSAFEVRTK